MATYTAADVVKLELPDDFRGSLIVRCLENEFGLSKSSNSPMITCKWEVVGIKNKDGGVDTKIVQGDKEYVISGLRTNKTYHTLSKKALNFFQDFWCKSQGIPLSDFSVDSENPNREHLNNLVMSATVEVDIVEAREKLTDEQRAELVAQGIEKPQGEIIIDESTGLPKKLKFINITGWNGRFNGELPAF